MPDPNSQSVKLMSLRSLDFMWNAKKKQKTMNSYRKTMAEWDASSSCFGLHGADMARRRIKANHGCWDKLNVATASERCCGRVEFYFFKVCSLKSVYKNHQQAPWWCQNMWSFCVINWVSILILFQTWLYGFPLSFHCRCDLSDRPMLLAVRMYLIIRSPFYP